MIKIKATSLLPMAFTLAERMGALSTVGKLMNASLYLSHIMDRYRLFENLMSLHIPEKRIIALDA